MALFTTGFIPPRWLALGFLNHQEYVHSCEAGCSSLEPGIFVVHCHFWAANLPSEPYLSQEKRGPSCKKKNTHRIHRTIVYLPT